MNQKRCFAADYIYKNGSARVDLASSWRRGRTLQSRNNTCIKMVLQSWKKSTFVRQRVPHDLTDLHALFNLIKEQL